jgi:deoxyribonuclease V
MSNSDHHDWNLSPAKARSLQTELATRVDQTSVLDVDRVQRVLAVDVSMNRFADWLTAAAVVVDVNTKQVFHSSTVAEPIEFPYVPGLLSFRELPAVLNAIEALSGQFNVIVVDGHGIAHPRGLGIAAHLGVWLDRPAVGLAKSKLCGTYDEPGPSPGSQSPLIHNEREVGVVLRTRLRASPIFVSVGHKCRLTDAVALAMRLTDGRRIPWPIRAAHEAANSARREHQEWLAEGE